jgi:DNA polymerase III subunit epsilon
VDFIAIDFEIANNKMSSACSLGMAFVDDQKIVDEKYFLIKPPEMEFDSKMIEIHGITPDDVQNAPTFNVVWEEIKQYFQGNTIIAHNAHFDMSVLHSCLTEYSIDLPEFEYICSIPISTRICKGEGIGNSLSKRLSYFNIELQNHHNALSDALACSELVLACMKAKNRKTIQSYCSTFSTIPVKKFSELKPQTTFFQKKKSRPRTARSWSKTSISEIAPTVETFDENHILYGKNIVFTGELQSIEREVAMQEVVNLGGLVKSGVSGKTNYLVVGVQDISIVGENGLSTKEKKAQELIEKGKDIKIIKEDEFINLLNNSCVS